MDPAIEFLQGLGYTNKDLHGMKPQKKIDAIARHYGFRASSVVKITNRQANHFLREFVELEHKNGESFSMLFRIHLAKYLPKYIPNGALDEHQITITNLPAEKFYKSREWRELRYEVLAKFGNKCMACGRSPRSHGVVIHVDHILPRSIYPEHALTLQNMQVLCEDCNQGKSNKHEDCWKR